MALSARRRLHPLCSLRHASKPELSKTRSVCTSLSGSKKLPIDQFANSVNVTEGSAERELILRGNGHRFFR